MTDDAVLLHRYAREKSQAAFAELVERRIDLVYGVALRKVGGDAHLAEDVAQRVFADVARKATVLASHPAFAGWLFRSTHYTATQLVRAERRRRAREEKAETMKEPWHEEDAARAIDWERLRPLLDDFISELGERDRAAVVGRFFEGLPLAEIGRRLQISEAGAQSRVERAVEKLRSALARRGVTSTSAALGVALANQAGAAAPASLATSVTTAALAGAAGATTGSALLIFMSATKTAFTSSVALSLAGVLLLTSVGLTLHQATAGQVIEIAWAAARDRQQAEDAERVRLERAAGDARRRLDEAKIRTAGLRAALAAPAEPDAGAKAGSAPRDPRADGRAFLKAIGEVERARLLETMRGQFRAVYGAMIREAGLSPAQVSELGLRQAQYWLERLVVTPADIGPDPEDDELPDAEVRAILGEEAFQRWELAGRKNPGNAWPAELALRLQRDPAAQPLTAAQSRELVDLVAKHSPAFRDGGPVDLDTVDWVAVSAEARPWLSAGQWRAAEAWLLKKDVEREIARRKADPQP